MDGILQTLSGVLDSATLDRLVVEYSWFWPICELLHFIGLTLLVGVTGLLDLRILGLAKGLPMAPIHRLVPWAIGGFALCVASGAVFVCGDPFNEPVVLLRNLSFQLKMLFVAVAGLNVAFFYAGGMHRKVAALGPGGDAPAAAKLIAGISLGCWIAVIYFGRMIPWADAIHYALGR
jgi:hypothetical protein